MGDRHRYRFVIEAVYTPETIPMARLAAYMAKLAALLGEKSQVHFVGMEDGSTVLVQEVEDAAHAKVRKRLHSANRSGGPPDATQAYQALDALLAGDLASGSLLEGGGPDDTEVQVLQFPGAKKSRDPNYGPVKQESTLQGVVIGGGGERDPVPVHLQDGGVVHNCLARRVVARELAQHIFGQPVRVGGNGHWRRDAHGVWTMSRFHITEFTQLNDDPLSEVLANLRDVASATPCPLDALETLSAFRRGED